MLSEEERTWRLALGAQPVAIEQIVVVDNMETGQRFIYYLDDGSDLYDGSNLFGLKGLSLHTQFAQTLLGHFIDDEFIWFNGKAERKYKVIDVISPEEWKNRMKARVSLLMRLEREMQFGNKSTASSQNDHYPLRMKCKKNKWVWQKVNGQWDWRWEEEPEVAKSKLTEWFNGKSGREQIQNEEDDMLNQAAILSGYYLYGVMRINIFQNLERMLQFLEKNYGLIIDDMHIMSNPLETSGKPIFISNSPE